MYGKILVGYQDTEQGRDALELGRIFARTSRAEMLVVTAPGENGEDVGMRVVGAGYDGSRAAGKALKIAADLIGVDLLVLGSRGGGPIRRSLRHSISNAVLAEAPCPVLISPSGVRAPVPA